MNYKHFALFICAALTYAHAFAQPRIKDQGVIGGDDDDVFTCMYLTSDGGLIVGGYSNSNISDQKTADPRGLRDYWVVKLDSNAKTKWDKTIGGNSDDVLYAVQQTTDGGYLLGGYSYSNISGDKTQDSRGQNDYWIVKLDTSGNIQWDKTIGGSNYDYLKALQQTTDGGYILGGFSESNKSGEKTQNRKGSEDYWIVKLDSDGAIRWDKTIGGRKYDELQALRQTTDGGYILGGYSVTGISGDKTEFSRGGTDYWVVKLNAMGSIQWDKTIGGSNFDDLWSLQQTADGGYILGGRSSSDISGEKTEVSRGALDYWVVKLNAIGIIQWDKTIGGNGFDELWALQQTTDGGYILGGSSNSDISGEKTENIRGDRDMWVVKTSSRGEVQWDKTIGENSEDGFPTVIVREIKRNDYVVGGSSISGISGDKTGGNRGISGTTSHDYWLVELKYLKRDSIVVAGIQNTGKLNTPLHNNNAFTAYPNPAHDQITIQTKGKASFILTNQTGKTVLTKTITNNGTIEVSHFPTGVYLLTNTATGTTQKLVITR